MFKHKINIFKMFIVKEYSKTPVFSFRPPGTWKQSGKDVLTVSEGVIYIYFRHKTYSSKFSGYKLTFLRL